MNNCTEINPVDKIDKLDINIIINFLNKCGIICSTVDDISCNIISREKLLDNALYDKVKVEISTLKPFLSSTTFTSMQKTAEVNQKWPLINLIRQILRKYNYQLVPKRVCDGYTKDGIKKYKRFFEVKKN
jgi:hypothetical protein